MYWEYLPATSFSSRPFHFLWKDSIKTYIFLIHFQIASNTLIYQMPLILINNECSFYLNLSSFQGLFDDASERATKYYLIRRALKPQAFIHNSAFFISVLCLIMQMFLRNCLMLLFLVRQLLYFISHFSWWIFIWD